MPEYQRLRPRNAHERFFRLLLWLYPHPLREEMGDAMVEFFRDRIADARRSHGSLGVLEAWGATVADALRHAPLARYDTLRRVFTRLTSPPLRAVADARREDQMLSSIWQDVRLAMRGMRRAPAFTALVIVTLALGMGANVAIFSIVNGILLKPLPFAEPERLIRIDQSDSYQTISEPEFADYRRDAHSLAGLAAYRWGPRVSPERERKLSVSTAHGSRMASSRCCASVRCLAGRFKLTRSGRAPLRSSSSATVSGNGAMAATPRSWGGTF